MAPRPAERAPTVLRIPSLAEERTPGAGIVKRAVTLLFGVIGGGFLLAVIVAALVTVDVTVDASGILEPVRVWPVRSQEPGSVVEVLVAAGDSVAVGQALLQLDTLQIASATGQLRSAAAESRLELQRASAARRVEQRQLDERGRQAEAAVIRARATLRQRLAEYGMSGDIDSLLPVYRPGTHSAIDLAVADVITAESERRSVAAQRDLLALKELELAKQRATLDGLTGQIATAQARRARLVIRAPAAGIVLTEQLEQLTGGFVREGDLLMELAGSDNWHATLYVNERDVHEVELGDPVKIEVQAFSRDRDLVRGRVVSVAHQPLSDADGSGLGGLYRVVAALDIGSLTLRQRDLRRGYTVRGKIVARSGRILTLVWEHLTDR